MDTVIETSYASSGDSHMHHESGETSDENESNSSNHDHSNGEHCVEVDFSLTHNNVIKIQKLVLNAVQAVVPELALQPVQKLYVGLEVFYDPDLISQNSFQGHIRSVLIRV